MDLLNLANSIVVSFDTFVLMIFNCLRLYLAKENHSIDHTLTIIWSRILELVGALSCILHHLEEYARRPIMRAYEEKLNNWSVCGHL